MCHWGWIEATLSSPIVNQKENEMSNSDIPEVFRITAEYQKLSDEKKLEILNTLDKWITSQHQEISDRK